MGGNNDADVIFNSGLEDLSLIPAISAFTAMPSVIDEGSSTTLSWVLDNDATFIQTLRLQISPKVLADLHSVESFLLNQMKTLNMHAFLVNR